MTSSGKTPAPVGRPSQPQRSRETQTAADFPGRGNLVSPEGDVSHEKVPTPDSAQACALHTLPALADRAGNTGLADDGGKLDPALRQAFARCKNDCRRCSHNLLGTLP